VGRFGDMKDLEKLSSHDMGYVFEQPHPQVRGGLERDRR
jgi:hypothetical protein